MQKGKIHVPNVGVGDTWRDAQFSFHIKVFTSPFFFWVAISTDCGTSAPSLITQDSKNAVCAYGVCASGSLRFAVCSGTRSGTSEASNERRTARRQQREAQTPRLAPSR